MTRITRGVLATRFPVELPAEEDNRGAELAGKRSGVISAGHDPGKSFRESLLLLQGKRPIVFDGIGNPAQEIGVPHRLVQVGRQLSECEREGAGNTIQHFRLECDVVRHRRVPVTCGHADADSL